MPSRLAAPVLTVDAAKMHTVDTRNVENLFGMWAVFSKCAESMEEGRRLENLSWRLWNRETFCTSPEAQATAPRLGLGRPAAFARRRSGDVPELSASVESAASDGSGRDGHPTPRSDPLDILCRPAVRLSESLESRGRGREKHVTSLDLEKMVMTIKENKELEPLPAAAGSVPAGPVPAEPAAPPPPAADATPRPSTPAAASPGPAALGLDVAAAASHPVVRGFSPGRGSSSYRSQSSLAPAAPIPTASLPPSKAAAAEQARRRNTVFMLGGSSGEDEDSLDEHMKPRRSSLTDGLSRKQTSFKDEVATRTIDEAADEDGAADDDEDVFTSDESDDDDDDDDVVSESAIEDDDSSDWEDSPGESARSSVDDGTPHGNLFQRVDSKPRLVSRRSLLTNLLHQPQRAAALANAASRSTPAMQRSRTSSPNGPSLAASPEPAEPAETAVPRSRPIIMTTSNTHRPALSPRTTRRNMLATELTESLRRHLLWERQQKNTTAAAVLKRRHTAHDVANLHDFPSRRAAAGDDASRNGSWNHYFDHGLGEYHQKGW